LKTAELTPLPRRKQAAKPALKKNETQSCFPVGSPYNFIIIQGGGCIMGTVKKLLEVKGHDTLCVKPESPVIEALKKMEDIAAGTALVCDESGLVGIVSERDCARKVILKKKNPDSVKVKDIMSTDLTTVTPDVNLERCLELMTEKRIRHLPVMEDGKCTGVISIGDCVKYMLTEQNFMIRSLENYISGTGMN